MAPVWGLGRRTFFSDVLLACLKGENPYKYFSKHPEFKELLLDFFEWRNDPSAFPVQYRTLEWRYYMRLLSFMVWNIELQAPKAAWGTSEKAPPKQSPLIIVGGNR